MKEITLGDVIEAIGGELLAVSENRKPQTESQIIRGVSIDSRVIKAGELFFAIKGKRTDGHYFVGEAVKKGAVAVIVDKKFRILEDQKNREYGVAFGDKVAFIGVDDTLKALGDLASWYRNLFSLPVIGITGSNGKTTTKELTAKCLGIRYQVCKSESSFNSLTGVPLSLFNLARNHEVCVLEVGANQVGEIPRLASIINPKIAVITNIAPTHLENFKTVERVLEEKLALARASEVPILNADDTSLSRVQLKGAFRFGIEKGDLCAELVVPTNGTKFKVKGVLFEFPLSGIHQIYNALAALAVGIHFDLDLQEMSQVLREVKPLAHRDEVIEAKGVKIIDSTYNANPVSLELALRELAKYKSANRRVAILGDMLELGEDGYDFHIKIGKLLKGYGIDVIIGYGELARGYVEWSEVMGKFYFDRMDVMKNELKNIIRPGDVILIKGSRAMRMEEIVKEIEMSDEG